jgi:hypothetical protein
MARAQAAGASALSAEPKLIRTPLRENRIYRH